MKTWGQCHKGPPKAGRLFPLGFLLGPKYNGLRQLLVEWGGGLSEIKP